MTCSFYYGVPMSVAHKHRKSARRKLAWSASNAESTPLSIAPAPAPTTKGRAYWVIRGTGAAVDTNEVGKDAFYTLAIECTDDASTHSHALASFTNTDAMQIEI